MKTLNDVNKKNDVKSKDTEEVKAEPEKIDFSKVKNSSSTLSHGIAVQDRS